jgi:hypothetical protein
MPAMPPKLVSDSQMAQLRTVAEMGMQSEVVITHRTYDDSNPYSDDEVVASTTTTTTHGWLRSTPAGDIRSINAMQAIVSSHRLFVPVGTEITTGDTVTVDGIEFTVQDTSAESTWKTVIRVILERIE